MLASQASFIARGYSFRLKHLEHLVKEAVKHKGFAFVDILQPCITFFDQTDSYNKRIYEVEEKDLRDKKKALDKIREWDYQSESSKIPLGIFYKRERSRYEKELLKKLKFPGQAKKNNFKKVLKEN
jgi:2-oxoglutarate ferredoxin oxidoreductase subunit beta